MVHQLFFYIFFKETKSGDTADAEPPSNLHVHTEKIKGMLILLEGKYKNLGLYYMNSLMSKRR